MKNTPLTRDFSKATLHALAAKGIAIVNAIAIPADKDDKYFSAKGYAVSDNGTYRVWAYGYIMNLVKEN